MPGNIISLSAEDIAAWPQPNYVDPHRRNWMPEYAGFLYGVATLMTGTRLWLRALKRSGGLGVDDVSRDYESSIRIRLTGSKAFLVCAWAALTWFTVLAILGSETYYTSRHLWDVPVNAYASMARIVWTAELSFLVCGCFVKISVLLFYRRLVRDTFSRAWKWAVICAITFTVAYTLAFILALALNCSPTEAYWEAFDPEYSKDYSCVNTTVINSLSGIMGILGDVYSVALPCIMTRNLMLPFAQKIGLYIVFGLGLFVTVASCLRTYYLHAVGVETDASWNIFNTFVWASLELNLSLMCASAPSLRVLFREYFSIPFSKIRRSVASNKNRKPSDPDALVMKQVAVSEETLRRDSAVKQCIGDEDEDDDDDEMALTKTTSSIPSVIRAPSVHDDVFGLQTGESCRRSGQPRLCDDWPKGSDGKYSWVQTREGRSML